MITKSIPEQKGGDNLIRLQAVPTEISIFLFCALPPSVTHQHGFDKKTVGIYLTHGYIKENLSLPFLLITFSKVYHNGLSPWKLSMSAGAIILFLQVGWKNSYTAF